MADWEIRYQDGFEHGFVAQDGISELEVPTGWRAVWVDDPEDGVLDRPEFKPKRTDMGHPEVIEGDASAAIFSSHGTIDGAIARAYEIDPNKRYFARAKVTNESGDPADKDTQAAVNAILIVAAYDASFPSQTLDTIVASEWYGQDTLEWAPDYIETMLTPEFQAVGSRVLVYLRTTTRWARPSATHFDAFELWEYGDVVPPSGGIQADLLAAVDVIQEELDGLRAIVEGMSDQAVLCVPLEKV